MSLQNVSLNMASVCDTNSISSVYMQATGGASKLLDSMERYGLYRSHATSDRESRDVSQDTNFGKLLLLLPQCC